jgi:hypothetical protein
MLHVLCSVLERFADRTWTASLKDNGFLAEGKIKSMFYAPIWTKASNFKFRQEQISNSVRIKL